MRPQLTAIADRQNGIFARHQALHAGYTEQEFNTLTGPKGSHWVRVRYGIYSERSSWDALTDIERAVRVDEAALLVCDEGTILSHSSAARRIGLPLYGVDDRLTHVTRVRTHGRMLSRIQAGIKHHCGLLGVDEVTESASKRVTDPARTVLDMTREFGYRTGLVAADAVLASGTSKAELKKRARATVTDTHAPTLAAVARDADARAESVMETLGRILLVGMGIDDLLPQFEIRLEDGGTAFADLYSLRLRHVFECDGRMKYRPQLDSRGRPMTADEVVWLEKRREDKIRGLGFGVSRILWADTEIDNFQRAAARLWREIRQQDAAGRRRRFGA